MKTWTKALVCIVLFFGFLLTSIGYAAVTDILSIIGSAYAEGEFFDVYISDISPEAIGGVTITKYFGTTMHSAVTAGGAPTFSITVVNQSNTTYVYERVIDGAEANVEGIYNGTDIAYAVSGITPLQDELMPGDSITFNLKLTNSKGITTDNFYLKFNFIEKTGTEILPGGDLDPSEPTVPPTEPETEPTVPSTDPSAPTDPTEPSVPPTEPPETIEPTEPDGYHDKFLGLVEALLSDTNNALNDNDLILDAVLESLTSKKRPEEDAPILHCDVNSISGGTMSAIAEYANAKIADDNIDFIFEAVDDPNLKETRLVLYMYYGNDCTEANIGKEIMVYRQIFTRGSNGVWFADGTYIGRATVGNYFGGGNSGKDVLTISPYSWKYGYP